MRQELDRRTERVADRAAEQTACRMRHRPECHPRIILQVTPATTVSEGSSATTNAWGKAGMASAQALNRYPVVINLLYSLHLRDACLPPPCQSAGRAVATRAVLSKNEP